MKVYRIEVTAWPTPTGQPWPRFIGGPGGGGWGSVADWEDEECEWFHRLADHGTAGTADEIEQEFSAGVDSDRTNLIIGWILPDPTRRHYFSGSAARRWVRRAQLLGAEARVVESDPIVWQEQSR